MSISELQVQTALKEITDPNTGKDFISTRSARNIKVDGADIAVECLPETGKEPAVRQVRRLTREAEFAILVTDNHQRSGLGTELLRRLVEIGRREGRQRITGDVLPENTGMQRAAQKLGFKIRFHEGLARAEMDLA